MYAIPVGYLRVGDGASGLQAVMKWSQGILFAVQHKRGTSDLVQFCSALVFVRDDGARLPGGADGVR